MDFSSLDSSLKEIGGLHKYETDFQAIQTHLINLPGGNGPVECNVNKSKLWKGKCMVAPVFSVVWKGGSVKFGVTTKVGINHLRRNHIVNASAFSTHGRRHTFAQRTVTLQNGVPDLNGIKMPRTYYLRTTRIYAKILDLKVSKDMLALEKQFLNRKWGGLARGGH